MVVIILPQTGFTLDFTSDEDDEKWVESIYPES